MTDEQREQLRQLLPASWVTPDGRFVSTLESFVDSIIAEERALANLIANAIAAERERREPLTKDEIEGMVNAAIAVEREQCAETVEQLACECCWTDAQRVMADECAAAIRARNVKGE